ncbi:AIPR family protein [Litoricolaceae bacterium]|nr:AIPR family protein [Litorivicinaceae bacterium]
MKIDLLEKKKEFLQYLTEESARRDEAQPTIMTDDFGMAFSDQERAPEIQSDYYIGDVEGKYQINGYGYRDPDSDDDPAFHLVITDLDTDTDEVGTLNASDVDRLVSKVIKAAETIADRSFLATQEEQWKSSILGYELLENLDSIQQFKIVIFSTRELRMRADTFKPKTLFGKTARTAVVDMRYWAEYELKGHASLEIDFVESFGSGIPCLKASTDSEDIESYLLAIPGSFLADIYATYGDRLLESNIRTFLSVRRDSVNDGMQRTIANNPNQFFAFNNGLTATAEEVETTINPEKSCLEITRLSNLQIVNGGQTTASLKYARDVNKQDLDQVFVQIKLNVLKNPESDPEQWAIKEDKNHDIVRKIARFSNTQNKVSASDLESNHQVLIELERQVKALKTPVRGDNNYSEDWFFERSRGRYNNLFAYKRGAELKKLKTQYPKHQYLEKTKAARYYLVFETDRYKKVPRGSWKVDEKSGLTGATQSSIGVQRAFEIFMDITKEKFIKTPGIISRVWASDFVAKAIIYIALDKEINASHWYKDRRGYKAQTVNYTLGLCAAALAKRDLVFDTRPIWQSQEVPVLVLQSMLAFARKVADIIFEAHPQQSNPSQFCKYNIAWTCLEHLINEVPSDVFQMGVPKEQWDSRLAQAAEISTGHEDATIWDGYYKKYGMRLHELEEQLKTEERFADHKMILSRLRRKPAPVYEPGDGGLFRKALEDAFWEED